MNIELIEKVVPELSEALIGTKLRNVFQLSADRLAIAFVGEDFHLLFISVEPRDPRIYLIRRRLRDLKRGSIHPSHFAVSLEKLLTDSPVVGFDQIGADRVVQIGFSEHRLVAQLTGKSSNLFLLDNKGTVLQTSRKPIGEGQAVGSTYRLPTRAEKEHASSEPDLLLADPSISESLDVHFRAWDEQQDFESLSDAARTKNRREIAKLNRLLKNLNEDLTEHGVAEQWKRFGDLLLANQATAERTRNVVRVRDLFDESAAIIEIEADENDSITEAAQKYFRRYMKARNARTAVENRLSELESKKRRLENLGARIETAIQEKDQEFLWEFVGKKKVVAQKNKRKAPTLPSGIRPYLSSDGFEILVGKKATDNDYLTSRIANSRDTWMHAADYPGSHVVIRNPDNKEVPHRTLIEAAQLAAFFSQGKKQTKAAVHYTLKKFVNKPKGVAPGLVRLASFKTILVEPKVGEAKAITR